MKDRRILIVAGPTAVGKTRYAIKLAKAFNGEIVSADSMQLYKYMDVGSVKPTERERDEAVHHLIDFVDPLDDFSVAKYQKAALEAIDDILLRDKLPIVSGGTGLYINSIIYNMDFGKSSSDAEYRNYLYGIAEEKGNLVLHEMLQDADKEAAKAIHPNNTKRIVRALERIRSGEGSIMPFRSVVEPNDNINPLMICLTRDRNELYERINSRVDTIMENGLISEIEGLMERGLSPGNISMNGIGYKEMLDYMNGLCSCSEAVKKIKTNTRHFAKRQLTWFRRYDKMKWFNLSEYLDEEKAVADIEKWVKERL